MADPSRKAELLRLFNETASIAATMGMRLDFTADDRAAVTLPYNAGYDHAAGAIHGGVYATLLDCAGWFTAAVAHETGCWMVTSDLSVRYLKPARRCALRAEGKSIRSGRRLDVVEMHLFDDEGELVGHATGTFLVVPGSLNGTPSATGGS